MDRLKSAWTFWAAVLGTALFTATTVCADEKAADEKPAAPGEVDISDIQNQYWKAHDKEFEVIQNKQYTKAGRIELAPMFGIYQRIDFQDAKTLGLSAAYHFSETWGVEAMGYKMFTSDAHVLQRFKENTGSTIDYNKERYYLGVGPVFTPIYAKFSLLGKKISHFDMYVTPNLGATRTNELRFTYGIAVGQKFWITPKWNFRVEYRWMQYSDKVNASSGSYATKNGGPGYFTDTVTDQNLMFGISYLFN